MNQLQQHPSATAAAFAYPDDDAVGTRYTEAAFPSLQGQNLEPLNLPLEDLRQITNNFSDEQLLGEGGFGKVYKGVLQNGDIVAVKKLTSTMPRINDKQFQNEVRHLMKLKHPNIVQLVGYCSESENTLVEYNGKFVCAEKPERLLCLVYLPKGSLREHLSDESSGLDWNTRYRIIEGICYGLQYLHEEWKVNTPIIHMDLKPPNILLDDNMVPKIADFGLSRLFGEEQTRTCTLSRDGTLRGYMAPEYLNRGIITKKLDIFSLGVIIIEIITGRKDYPYETETSSKNFIELVIKNWRNRLEKLPRYESWEIDCQEIRRCIQTGLVCVKLDWEERPTICQIIQMLQGKGNERELKVLNPCLTLTSEIRLPHFAVHATEGEQSSNLFLLKDVTPPELEISDLENVKSVQETHIIELRKKQSIEVLTLDWTKGKKGHVEDLDLLSGLIPPSSLKEFVLRGYNSKSFPTWLLMGIANYLPNLTKLQLIDLPQCSSLPAFGQLPNLQDLTLRAMPKITKIDKEFCGGEKAFANVRRLFISKMKSLEEWSVAWSSDKGVADEFMFPNLEYLTISRCHKLKLKPGPPRATKLWEIIDSDDVLLQWGDNVPHTSSSTSSALVPRLRVCSCMAPMHQWKLLHHLPALDNLTIQDCNDPSGPLEMAGVLCSLRKLTLLESCHSMTSLPEWMGHLTSLRELCIHDCSGIQALPEQLGDLASLESLVIKRCPGILSFPESIQQLTNLRELRILKCPALRSWCELEDNMAKIGHIEKIKIDEYIRLQKKGALIKSPEPDKIAESSE